MNEQNNNIDNNNIINEENNIDNNLNNNNINNANNNQINFEVPDNVNYANKYKKITISFIIILFINIIIEIYSYFIRTDYRKYVFQYAPIFEKKQYYRFISSYFIHYGIWHIIVELYLTYEICYLFENIMGTLITILFILKAGDTGKLKAFKEFKACAAACGYMRHLIRVTELFNSSRTVAAADY